MRLSRRTLSAYVAGAVGALAAKPASGFLPAGAQHVAEAPLPTRIDWARWMQTSAEVQAVLDDYFGTRTPSFVVADDAPANYRRDAKGGILCIYAGHVLTVDRDVATPVGHVGMVLERVASGALQLHFAIRQPSGWVRQFENGERRMVNDEWAEVGKVTRQCFEP